ncbi:MAG: glycerol-3-phosphate acyltransferase [Opitutaceae bacterium]|jgi:glycerol-3-phosphate acyltransferase PlsY
MGVLSQFTLIASSFLLGGISPGFLLVRWKTGADVRSQGSGGSGATNVGRVLGRGGFAAVMTLDIAKGAAAVFAARIFGGGALAEQLCALAVVAGHVWPVGLGFKGGKGAATMLGAWLVMAPVLLLPGAVLTLLARLIFRFSLAGLIGLATLPVLAFWNLPDPRRGAAATLAFGIVAFAHRDHIRRWREGSRIFSTPNDHDPAEP